MRIDFARPRRKLIVGIVAIAAFLLPLTVSARDARGEPLRIAVYRGIHCALIYLAQEQGLFKTHDIDLEMMEYESGVQAVNDFIADKADIATASDFAFVLQSLKHSDLRMPAAICRASDEEIVFRKDRGISRPRDLIGKRVAVIRGGQTEFFLHNYLVFNGVAAGSVEVVDLTPIQMVKEITGGTVDAALCWWPYTLEMAKQLGANGTRWPAQSGQDYHQVLFVKQGFTKNRSRAVENFLAALLDAEVFVARYPDRARNILVRRLKLDAEQLLSAWSLYRFHLELSQDLLVLMEREAKWAIRNNLVEKSTMPNYLDFFYFDAIDKVKPDGVSVVH